ncbi:MAG: hypothetical protein HY815_05250 [Candidatus Riflebacteria bacterium]|nr:hypothetical protein [Candidatus Riflebacteria bacterium]
MKRTIGVLRTIAFLLGSTGAVLGASNSALEEPLESRKPQKVVRVDLVFSEDKVEVERARIVDGAVPVELGVPQSSEMFCEVLSSTGEVLHACTVHDPRKLHYTFYDEATNTLRGGTHELDRASVAVFVPDRSDAAEIAVMRRSRGRAGGRTESASAAGSHSVLLRTRFPGGVEQE